jgi:hypothetical protein
MLTGEGDGIGTDLKTTAKKRGPLYLKKLSFCIAIFLWVLPPPPPPAIRALFYCNFSQCFSTKIA